MEASRRAVRQKEMTPKAWARLAAVALASIISASSAFAHEGWGIVRDTLGRLYIADIPANIVWRVDPDGRMHAVIRDVHSHALVIGADGSVYGTHGAERSVWRLDLNGSRTQLMAPSGVTPLNLQPFLIASDGSVYSVSVFQYQRAPESRELFLLRREAGGAVDTIAGGLTGHEDGRGRAARFRSIDGMAWLPDSTIVLVDGARLRRVDRDGVVTSLTPELTTPQWDQDLMGVSVAPDSAIYVADFAGRRVLRIKGETRSVVARTGWWWAPTGVTYAAGGIYTLEHPRAPFGILGDLKVGAYLRVRRTEADGRTRVVARRWGERSKFVAATAAGVGVLMLMLMLLWRRW